MNALTLYRPSTVFYTGAQVSNDVPFPFHCAIAGHAYMIDTRRFERGTVEVTRQGFDPSGEPGEQTLSSEGIWKRWGDDWSYGTAQDLYDGRNSDRRRFYSSEGIDPWAERGAISLLPDTAKRLNSSNTNLAMLTAGTRFYIADGSDLKHTTNMAVSSPTFTTVAMGANVQSITTDGAYVYAAVGTDIERTAVGGTTKSVFSTQDATLVGYANGRLLAANANVLYEISGAGTATTLYTHLNGSATFSCIVGTPTGIFVGLNNGETGEFLYVGFNATTGGLAVPLPAGALNRGESIHAMQYYQGSLLLGTTRGIRLAEIVQDRGIAVGPVIETDEAVRCTDVEGEYAWFGYSNGGTAATGVARANLAREASPSVPAWASDVMAAGTSGAVTAVARFGGRTYFAVSASGVWGETDNRVATGTLDAGWIRFGTVERLVLYSVDLFHDPLAGQISVSVVPETGSETGLGESTVAGSCFPANFLPGNDIASFAFRLRFTLTRSSTDTTQGPSLLRWVLRAMVAPAQVERITVPILLYDPVLNETGEGQTIPVDVLEEWDFLKALERNRSVVQFQMFGRSEPVTVRQVQIPAGAVRGFNGARTHLDHTVLVTLMTMGT